MSIFNSPSTGVVLPQPLGPTDTPTFKDVILTDLAATPGFVTADAAGLLHSSPTPVIPGLGTGIVVSTAGTLSSTLTPTATSLSLTGTTIMTSSASGQATTLSVPLMSTTKTITVPEPPVSTSVVLADFPGGNQTLTGNLTVSGSIFSPGGPVGSASAINAPIYNVQGTNVSPSIINFNTSASHTTTLSVPATAQNTTLTLPDPALAAARLVMSAANLTAGIVTATGTTTVVSSTTTPTVTSVAFSSNVTTPLSAYTEGTWTPSIAFGGASTGWTFSPANGSYTRIGNRVFFNVHIQVTAVGSSTGNAFITGLPYAAASGVGGQFACTILWTGVNFTASYIVAEANIPNTTTTIQLLQVGASPATPLLNLTNTNIPLGTIFQVTGCYPTTAAAFFEAPALAERVSMAPLMLTVKQPPTPKGNRMVIVSKKTLPIPSEDSEGSGSDGELV